MSQSDFYGVYAIRCVHNGREYIGAGNVKRRFREHRSALCKGTHTSKKLQQDWSGFGEQAFEFLLLETCAPENCIIREQHYLDKLKPYNNGYNQNKKATLAGIPNPRLSRVLTGRKLSPKQIETLKATFTPERRAALSTTTRKAMKGKPKSPEHREKLVERCRANNKDPRILEKIAASKRGKKRPAFSAEWRENLSKSRLGKPRGPYKKRGLQ